MYATTKTENNANKDFSQCKNTVYRQDYHTGYSTLPLYLLAKPNSKSEEYKDWVFSHWENKDGERIISDNPGQVTDTCKQISTDKNNYVYNTTYYAVFVAPPAVKAFSENVADGTASIDKASNQVGDKVTLMAREDKFNTGFVGWKFNGEIVSSENPYTFTITEEKKGDYYAVFRDDYHFYRIKNYSTHRYVNAVDDNGSLWDLHAFALVDGAENVLCEPGSIVEIRIHYAENTARTEEYAIITQGIDSYDIAKMYMRMNKDYDGVTKLWEPNADGTKVQDNNGKVEIYTKSAESDLTKWIVEKVDLDLSWKKNYFSVSPEVQDASGLWWTTLRTSWNCRFADATHKDITAYIVTGIDENGEAVLEEVTGDIIPAGVPVVLMCKTNDPEKNVMIPTTEDATFDAAANILASSVKYFDNQPLPDSGSTYRKLTRRSDGSVGFIDVVADNTMNGNRAYLVADEDVMLPEREQVVTLAGLVSEGEVGKKYAVTDLTCVAVREIDNEHTALYCKDDNAVAADARQVMADGQTDYMAANGFGAAEDYDQSHWLELTIPGKVGSSYNPIGRRLTDVSGTLTDLENPALTARALPTIGDENAYTLNNYIVPSLQGTQAGNNDRTYFFVTPQVMEVAKINWAQWDATAQKFITPPSTTPGVNTAGLQGEFFANFSYAKGSELIENYPYSFKAVLRSEPGTEASVVKAPRRAGGTKSLVAYPLEPLTVERQGDQVVTTVDRVTAGRQVLRVDYCNLQGQVSHTPWPGLNIEVTRFDDGTVATRKVLK